MHALPFLFLLPLLAAAEPGPLPAQPPVADGLASGTDETRVAVLGYHDFSETQAETEMRMKPSKFRAQMSALRDSGLPVISMPDFDAWKSGKKSLPKECVVITIDDGWKSVYTDAYPVLKEFNFPFTLFLYKNYIDGGGKALSSDMIREMTHNGANIGSHSVSHHYPATIKQRRREGPEKFLPYLRTEFGESKRFLESRFGEVVTSYAYPGGFATEEMFPVADEFGYRYLFTVLPGKINRDSDNYRLPRYIVLGTRPNIFDQALRFSIESTVADTSTPPYPVSPGAGSITGERLPLIRAELAEAGPIDPKTIAMKVSGFGTVPAVWNPDTKTISWQTNRRLHAPMCRVEITWKDASGKEVASPLRWSFRLDREEAYLDPLPSTPAN